MFQLYKDNTEFYVLLNLFKIKSEMLKGFIKTTQSSYLVLRVDIFEVCDDVISKKLSQGFVLTLEQVEEQLQQVGQRQQVLVTQQNECTTERHTHILKFKEKNYFETYAHPKVYT